MTTRRSLALACAIVAIGASVAARGGSGAQPGWYAGDLHVHTTYSHDSFAPVGDDEDQDFEPWVLGHSVQNQFMIAAARGLDFLAITDHNDIRAQTDPGFGAGEVVGIAAYENSLSGHAQMLGATACYAPEGTFPGPRGCNAWPDRTPERVTAMADLLRADGGLFQINHPYGYNADDFPEPDWGMGHLVVPDSVEVWNIQSVWQPPAPSSNSIDDAIRFWEGFLDAGHRVAATGGSDNHWVSTTAIQGVGQPTTWVYAADRTAAAILDGIEAGHTTISWQPPALGGPRMFLEADADGDGTYEAVVGDSVPHDAAVRVRTELRPPGAVLSVVFGDGSRTEGSAIDDVLAVDVSEEQVDWVRAELLVPDHTRTPLGEPCDEQIGASSTLCRNRLVRVAMTSALFVG